MKLIKELTGVPRDYPTKNGTIRLLPFKSIEVLDKDINSYMLRDFADKNILIIDVESPKQKEKKEDK